MSAKMEAPLVNLLPPDVLCCVTEFLDAVCIARLYLCGNRKLIWNFTERGGVKTFALRFRCNSEMRWPSLVKHFRTLEHFLLEQSPYGELIAVQNVDLTALTPTLRSLCLFFVNGYASLFEPCVDDVTPSQAKNIKRMWPCLETLDFIMHEDSVMPLALLNVLPDSLTRFKFVGTFPLEEMKLLPRCLRELELQLEAQYQDWSHDPLFPPDLISLSISNVLSSRIISYFPRGLENLFLGYGAHYHWWEDGISNIGYFDLLTRQLQSLDISAPECVPLTLEMVQALPREMKSLRLMSVTLNPRVASFEAILRALPPCLNSLRLRHVGSAIKDVDFLGSVRALPKTLTDISGTLMQIGEALCWFPPRIRYLRLSRVTRELAAAFPETLESLAADSLYSSGDKLPVGADASTLPSARSLLESSTLLASPVPWAFPKSLRALDVWSFISFEAAKALESLPLLKHALLGASSLCLADYLPTSTLQIRLSGAHCPDLPLLSQPPQLENVQIDHIFVRDSFTSWNPLFPSTLHTLKLEFSPIPTHADFIRQFNPRTLPLLTALNLEGLASLSNHHLSNLPPLLSSIRIDASIAQYNSDCIDHLPKSIARLILPKPSDYPMCVPNFLQHRCLSLFKFVTQRRLSRFEEFEQWQSDKLQAQREAVFNIGTFLEP